MSAGPARAHSRGRVQTTVDACADNPAKHPPGGSLLRRCKLGQNWGQRVSVSDSALPLLRAVDVVMERSAPRPKGG